MKAKGIGKIDWKLVEEIDKKLDEADALIEKYGLYMHEALAVVEGYMSLDDAIKEHKKSKKKN